MLPAITQRRSPPVVHTQPSKYGVFSRLLHLLVLQYPRSGQERLGLKIPIPQPVHQAEHMNEVTRRHLLKEYLTSHTSSNLSEYLLKDRLPQRKGFRKWGPVCCDVQSMSRYITQTWMSMVKLPWAKVLDVEEYAGKSLPERQQWFQGHEVRHPLRPPPQQWPRAAKR